MDLSHLQAEGRKSEFDYTAIENGFAAHARGEYIAVHLPPEVSQNEKFGSAALSDLSVSASVYHGLAQRHADGITGKAFQHDVEVEITKTHAPRTALIAKVRERGSELDVARKTALDYSFLDNQYPSPLRSDHRRDYLSLDQSKRVAAALNSDLPLAISILEGGKGLSGLPPELWAEFEEHAMELLYVQRHASDAEFRRKPSLDRITASGVDTEAARKAARAAIDRHKAELEAIELAESYLQQQLRVLSALTRRKPEDFL